VGRGHGNPTEALKQREGGRQILKGRNHLEEQTGGKLEARFTAIREIAGQLRQMSEAPIDGNARRKTQRGQREKRKKTSSNLSSQGEKCCRKKGWKSRGAL